MHLLGGQTWQRWTWEERRSAITPCRSMAPCCHHTSPRHRCQDSQSSDGRTWSLGGAIRNLLSNVGRARSGGGGVLLNPISKLKSGPDGSDGKHGTTQSRRLGSRLQGCTGEPISGCTEHSGAEFLDSAESRGSESGSMGDQQGLHCNPTPAV